MTTKIICAYHKGAPQKFNPLIIQHPDIFVPVLGGSRIGGPTVGFFQVMLHDDTGDNISYLNSLFSENTVLYWAYKHYREIGNPDIIGFCHYRRFFDVDYTNLDPNILYLRRGHTVHPEWARFNMYSFMGIPYTQLVIDEFLNDLPEYKDALELVLDDYNFFDKCMFIMNRSLFFQLMQYLMRCYRVVQKDPIRTMLVNWMIDYPSTTLFNDICGRPSASYYLENMMAVFFTRLQLIGYPIHLTSLTEDSFNDY